MNSFRKKAGRAIEILRESGIRGLRRSAYWNYWKINEQRKYQRWIRKNAIDRTRLDEIRNEIDKMAVRPLISVVMPVYNVDEKWLRLCIGSVTRQIYQNWELCVADDCSPSPHIKKVLAELAAGDGRIKVVYRPENGHISAASNSALSLATGEFTVLLDHDDELSPDALFYVAKEIAEHPETAMIYSDEDLIDEKGRRFEPKFKPDFSRDLFYSLNLITHLSAYRTELLRKISGFRIGLEGSQDYDLALRVIEQIDEDQIRHIPRILYHWRAIRGSVAFSGDEKPYAHERAREALRSHFERTGKLVHVEQTIYNLHRVRYVLPETPPKVSLVIRAAAFSGDMEDAVAAFANATAYPNYEIIIVTNDAVRGPVTISGRSVSYLKSLGSAAADMNEAASRSNGEILCFTDLSLMPLNKDWLTELCRFANQPEIGPAGAKLLTSDGSTLTGGIIIGAGGAASAAYSGFPRDFGGIMGRNVLPGNFAAVSAGCFAVRKELFAEAGGFDPEPFPDHLFDADLCLRIGEMGHRIVMTPFAELICARGRIPECAGKPDDGEADRFKVKWKKYIGRDPFYNPNLSRKHADFSIDA